MNILEQLQRKPFPKCAYCDTRAHGLFMREVTTRDILSDDEVVEERVVYANWRDPITKKARRAKITAYIVKRMELLCAAHGFKFSGTTLIRSLSTPHTKPSPAPETMVGDSGLTQSQVFTNFRRTQIHSRVDESIINSLKHKEI